MSLDITLYDSFCPCCGRGESVYWADITHNLTGMAEEAGVYQILWRNPGTSARALIEPLNRALVQMHMGLERFKKHDSPNGWGTYADFLPWLERLHAACVAHPDARVSVSV